MENLVKPGRVAHPLRSLQRVGIPDCGLHNASHPFTKDVFSPMTSFTHRPGTSFTLPARAEHALGCNRDGVEDDGCSRTTRAFCGGGNAEDADVSRPVRGLRDLSTDGISVA